MGDLETVTTHVAATNHRRQVRLAALRHLAGQDGANLDVAVMLGLTDEDGAERLRRALHPGATAADPAGCAHCGRPAGAQRGCGICWAREWKEGQG